MSNPADAFISLRCLYSFVKQERDHHQEALNLERALGETYSRRCEDLTKNIEDIQGIYVWGRFDKRKYWNSIYLGKAGLGKSKKLLHDRITEELKDERCFLWRHVLSEQDLFRAGPSVHRRGQEAWCSYIEKVWKRSVRKAGTTHIIFTPTRVSDNNDVRKVEAELIEALQPKANVAKPLPPSHVFEEAARIFSHFRQTIHHIRSLKADEGGPFNLELV